MLRVQIGTTLPRTSLKWTIVDVEKDIFRGRNDSGLCMEDKDNLDVFLLFEM